MSKIDTAPLLAGLAPKEASTGSKGFMATQKVVIDGCTYQAQVSAWLIGSKADPKSKVKASIEDVRAGLAAIVPSEKTFSSGKTGYHGQGKVVIGSERFQSAVQLVKVG
jgi:hypothetical protein